jgi:hypothetical protein
VPFILGLIAIAVGGYVWMNRARNAAYVARDLADMAGDVLGAARRFGFRRQANIHPVESLEDAGVAVAALGIGYLELAGLPRAEQHDALVRSLQVHLQMSHDVAAEAVILGRWLITECGGPVPGIDRLARRLKKLRPTGFVDLMAVIKDVSEAGGGTTSPRQGEALAGLARVFGIS